MITKLAFHRFSNRADLLTEGGVLELGHHHSPAKPSQVAAVDSGAGILRNFTGNIGEIVPQIEIGLRVTDTHKVIDKDMTRPDLFLCARNIGSYFFKHLVADQTIFVHGA